MGNDIVFVGPSLPATEVVRLLPGATVRPPVQHGDLLRLDAEAGDRVFIIDGLFLQTAPVRHREILYLLERGVTVAGSSSMGALRAAELWPFGMRGVGEVFRLYREGIVTGDDEVAIVHGPPEEGYRALSEPMVNIRVTLAAAARNDVLTPVEADTLLELVRASPFPARTYRRLEREGRRLLGNAPLDRFITWAEDHAVDVKTEDARLMLRRAASGHPDLRPHGLSDEPIRNVHTHHMDRWRARLCGEWVQGRYVPDVEVIAALMLTHPGFPAAHRRRVLAELAGTAPDDGAAPKKALELARARGIAAVAAHDTPWLLDAELAVPDDEALTRTLVRAFGNVSDRALTLRIVPPELAIPPVLAAARAFLGEAQAINDTLPRIDQTRPGRRMRFRDEVIDRVFAELWGTAPAMLPAAVWDRGFSDLPAFRVAAEPMVAYLRTKGAPAFPVGAPIPGSGVPRDG